MNILLIHQYFLEKDDPGGSRFNEMTRVWVSEGHHVTVLCGMLNYVTGKVPDKYVGLKYHQSEYEPNLQVLRCYVSPEYNTNFVGRLWAYFSFVWYGIWGALFKLKGRKFDVIIATSPPLFIGIIAWITSRLKRVPYVFEVRDLWPESAVDTGVLTNKFIIRFAYGFEKFIYRGATLINVLTPAFREKLILNKNIDPEKIIFIPNACDFTLSDHLLNDFDAKAFRQARGWNNHFVITYVGAHGVANHLVQLLDVAERMRKSNVHVVLIGDGMQKPVLKSEAEKRELTNVEFVDSMPKRDVMKYILASDAGTSVLKRVDTFKTVYSNKTFDYMACQKPILMLIDGVSRKLVEDARCGLYAEPENIDDIVTKIEILSGDLSLCQAMGERGYVYARENFDRQELARKYVLEIQNRLKLV
ncbi:MAG TPA: glycosyltransferase family 4 protein [Ohtaekwangia sp.]